MEEYIKVKSKNLVKYGRIIDKTLYLKTGVYCLDKFTPINELYVVPENKK